MLLIYDTTTTSTSTIIITSSPCRLAFQLAGGSTSQTAVYMPFPLPGSQIFFSASYSFLFCRFLLLLFRDIGMSDEVKWQARYVTSIACARNIYKKHYLVPLPMNAKNSVLVTSPPSPPPTFMYVYTSDLTPKLKLTLGTQTYHKRMGKRKHGTDWRERERERKQSVCLSTESILS